MEFFCGYLWEMGKRTQNEDALCIRQVTKEGKCWLLAVVCDGIGGLCEGENASSYVVSCMLEHFQKIIKKNTGKRKLQYSFFRQLYLCHQALLRYGNQKSIQLGTTVSMLFICGRKGYLYQVGDSGIFYGKRQLHLRAKRQLSPSGALLQAVGVGKAPKPYCKRFYVRNGMVFLLATDGFFKRAEAEICSREWRSRVTDDEGEITRLLHQTANKVQAMGEQDNISAICLLVKGKRQLW